MNRRAGAQGRYKSVMVAVSPCRSDMSRRGLAPWAHLADGRLTLVLVRDCSILQYLRFLTSIPRFGAPPAPLVLPTTQGKCLLILALVCYGFILQYLRLLTLLLALAHCCSALQYVCFVTSNRPLWCAPGRRAFSPNKIAICSRWCSTWPTPT